jgi:hypothetical protein
VDEGLDDDGSYEASIAAAMKRRRADPPEEADPRRSSPLQVDPPPEESQDHEMADRSPTAMERSDGGKLDYAVGRDRYQAKVAPPAKNRLMDDEADDGPVEERRRRGSYPKPHPQEEGQSRRERCSGIPPASS